jgi:flagellar L-ring protein precursor FlgH
MIRNRLVAVVVLLGALVSGSAMAQTDNNLFRDSSWANVAGDQKASRIGDALTVIVYQNAESRNAAQNAAQRRRGISGELNTDVLTQNGELSLNGDYLGRGETRRSESFVTQISVVIEDRLPNGDLIIAGEQLMHVNGEKTRIAVRGRIRPTDISPDNYIFSTHIADAQINYEGEGFVSRNTDGGLFGWLFNLLGFSG